MPLHLSSVSGCKDINNLFDYKRLKKKMKYPMHYVRHIIANISYFGMIIFTTGLWSLPKKRYYESKLYCDYIYNRCNYFYVIDNFLTLVM